MTNKQVTRNVRLYTAFQVVCEPLFFGAILINYLQKYGKISLPDIYIMEGTCLVLMSLLEIPSGAIADLLGRKYTVAIGALINCAHVVMLVFLDSPQMAWLANITWVVGFSLVSNADSSIVYDSLVSVGQKERFKKIKGNSFGYRLYAIAFGSLATGFLAEICPRIPMAMSATVMFAPFVISLFFVEPPNSEKGNSSFRKYGKTMRRGILLTFSDAFLRWSMLFAILLGVVSRLWFFSYTPYFELVGLPLGYNGLVFFLLNIVAAIFSHNASAIHRGLGDFKSVVMMVMVMGVPLIFMGMLSAEWCVLFVLFQNVVRGYLPSFIEPYQQQLYESETRATCGSVTSAVGRLGDVAGYLVYGTLLKHATLQQGFIVLGIFTLLAGSLLIWRFRAISS